MAAVRRQVRKLQQKVKEQREARRGAKRVSGPRQRGARGNFFQKRGNSGNAARELLSKAQVFEQQLDVRNAIKAYEEATELAPTDFDYLARCSKAWSDATYLDEITGKFKEKLTDQAKRGFNEKALGYSKKAMDANPKASLPHVAACISMGRLALFSENKAKVKLAKEAREHAITALELEPGSDLAHHLMGRWHWEMAQLNVVVRTLIRLAFGTALPPGSHQDALQSYCKATQLCPERLIHRVELGRAYHKLGRREEAWRELEAAVVLDVEDINAHLQKIDADTLLKSLRKDAAKFHWAADAGSEVQGKKPAEPGGFVIRLPRFKLPLQPQLPRIQWPPQHLPKTDNSFSQGHESKLVFNR